MADSLLEELKQTGQLPSAPGVAVRIVELNQRDEIDFEELALLLGQDPVLAAKVVRTANSSMFGQTREVANLRQAALILGFRSVNMLALSFSLTNTMASQAKSGFDYRRYWTHALATTLGARLIAERTRPGLRDEAFLAGLLCEIGQLVLVQAVVDRYAPILEQWRNSSEPLCDIEEREFGFSHMDVGGDLLDHWGLPNAVCHAIGAHHQPEVLKAQTGDAHPLAEILHVATTCGKMLAGGDLKSGTDELRELGQRYFGFGPEECGQILEEIMGQLPEMAALLELDTDDPETLFEIRTKAMDLLVQESMALDQQVHSVTSEVQRLEEQQQDLERQATTDTLTGLHNRRFFDETLERALANARETGQHLGLLIADLDHFKSVNDEHGHHVGDELLRHVGRTILETVGTQGVACRYGGEEITVICPGVMREDLHTQAETIRAAVGALEIEIENGTLGRTVSIGACWVRQPRHHTPAELIEAADRELYAAKSAGRDRVRICEFD
jgi:diguanylate cyclase (GGDEF)-like protein